MNHVNMTLILLFITVVVSRLPQTIFAAHNHHIKAESQLVEAACNRTRHKDSCVEALESDPNARVSDLKGLALIALKLASSNASDASEHLKAALADDTLDPAVQDAASECLDQYLDAAEQLDDSVAALLADAPRDVKMWVHVAVTDAHSCDSALGGHARAVMGGKGEAFRRLCSYALAVNELLAEQAKSHS